MYFCFVYYYCQALFMKEPSSDATWSSSESQGIHSYGHAATLCVEAPRHHQVL